MHDNPILHNAWIIVALPFIAGALIVLLPFLGRLIPILPTISRDTRGWKTFSMLLSIGAVAVGFVHSILIFQTLAHTQTPYIADALWFKSASFTLTTGLLIDNLTSVMLIIVTTISLLVQIYTHSYMREDPGYSRFYAYLSLFTGSMLGLVVATNLFQMFLFWELVGVCSYFLIGFWFYKKSAADACMKAFIVNRIGDFGFLVGILMLLYWTWGFWQGHPGHGILSFSDVHNVDIQNAIKWAFTSGTPPLVVPTMTLIACLMFMGPMAKSAQMPLHVWLPDAMEGPTPISALIHAATMVAAGVYMVARAYPIWLNWADPANPVPLGSPSLEFVAWIGTITALMAATIALTQVDIKRILAWSTVSQLGYMFAGLGVGAFTGGIFHLFTHAFFKAMLFLGSGAVIHALAGEQDVRKMGGLRKDLFWTRITFLVGCMAIMGFPGMSGFFSKDEIIGASAVHHPIIMVILIFTSGLTAFYMFRCYFLTFSNEYRGEAHVHREIPWKWHTLTAPLVVLMIPAIFAGLLGFAPGAWMHGPESSWESPFGMFIHWDHMKPEAVNLLVVTGTVLVSFAGWALAAAAYWKRSTNFHTGIAAAMPWAYNFSLNRWYWDSLYLKSAQFFLYGGFAIWTLVDKLIVDNIVNATATITRGGGSYLRYTETGRGQYYAMVIFGCVAVISLFVYFTRPGS